jgi:hypothetical protein
MDYVVCQAANYRTGEGRHRLLMLLIYDIACQWIVYFKERVKHGKMLNVSDFQTWLVAIEKFHLAVHVKSCYWLYTLNYMKGVGLIDGEIMETLWAIFNKFALMARSMGNAHRKEILNDYMRDWNWKKLVGMGEIYRYQGTCDTSPFILVRMLTAKRKKAVKELSAMTEAYEGLSSTLPAASRKKWLAEEEVARKKGGDAMNIYGVDIEKGTCQPSFEGDRVYHDVVLQAHPSLKYG